MTGQPQTKEFYDKLEKRGVVLGLDSMRRLLHQLGDPQERVPAIHVAGTNGKGSLCCYLRAILAESGYRVGVYTSPAVFDERERYVIGDQWISAEEYEERMLLLADVCRRIEEAGDPFPTKFEVETALAFCWFADCECDLMVIEAGMGGETDATNVISHPLCSVFTAIGADHIPALGKSIAEVAKIKSGIIKRECAVVSTWQTGEVAEILLKKTREYGGEISFARRDLVQIAERRPLRFSYRSWEEMTLSMEGEVQVENGVLALEVVEALRRQGICLPGEAVCRGLHSARLPGRMECICENPLCYLDGAHNLPAARRLKETLKNEFTNKEITYIIGVLADKDYPEMLRELAPLAEKIFTVTPPNPRALPGTSLAQAARPYCEDVVFCPSFSEAAARAIDTRTDMILAFGSLSYLGEIRKALTKRIEDKDCV